MNSDKDSVFPESVSIIHTSICEVPSAKSGLHSFVIPRNIRCTGPPGAIRDARICPRFDRDILGDRVFVYNTRFPRLIDERRRAIGELLRTEDKNSSQYLLEDEA